MGLLLLKGKWILREFIWREQIGKRDSEQAKGCREGILSDLELGEYGKKEVRIPTLLLEYRNIKGNNSYVSLFQCL